MFFPPMLLQNSINNLPFDHTDYLASLKLDGIRLLVSYMDSLRIYTKHQEVTDRFPELHMPPVSKGTILDGELIVTDEKGYPDFEACMSRFQSQKSRHHIEFCAFDILFYRGEQVTSLPLESRLELLERELEETEYYKRMRIVNGSATQFFNVVKAAGLEGIVLKNRHSRYETRRASPPGSRAIRSWSWQKVINYSLSDVVVTGYSKIDHHWLIGMKTESGIRPLGSLELGLTPQHRRSVWPILGRSIVGENKSHVFVDPRVTCRVKHRGYYKSGLLRLPVLEQLYKPKGHHNLC